MEKGLIFLEIQIRWSLYFIKLNHINPTPFLSVAKCYKTMKWKKKKLVFLFITHLELARQREGYADQESESTVLNSGAIYIGNIDISKGKC